jgi:site-specific DNA-methyltransferase (adenine-specific)
VEACLIDGKRPSNVLPFWFESGEKRIHEAQKPIKLIEFLIKLTTQEDQIVLDSFIGGGTTAVACKRLNRRYIGFEINGDYAQKALARLNGSDH